MNRKLTVILCLAACFLLLANATNAAYAYDALLSIAHSCTVMNYDSYTVTDYEYDKVILHKSGVYEVRGSATTDGVTAKIRWFYAADGVPLGSREYNGDSFSDSLDYVYYLENDFDTYAEYQPNVDWVEGNTIYYTDGSYEVATLKDGRIEQLLRYYEDGSVGETRVNEYGQLLELNMYEAQEATPHFQVMITYTMLNPSEVGR